MEGNVLAKGLALDNSPLRYESGEYSFALNAVISDEESLIICNEKSNEIAFSLDDGFTIIGAINMEGEEVAIFSTNGSLSEIGIYDGSEYKPFARLDLGFSKDHRIKGVYFKVNNCDRTVYWTDGINPDYYFNFDKLDLFKTNGIFDKEKFRLQSNLILPRILEVEVLDSGGSLEVGSYEFVVEVLDEALNFIGKSLVSRPVIIYDESINAQYDEIDGAVNKEFNPDGISPVNKSILLTIDNVDTSYKYLRYYVIRSIGGSQVKEVFQLSELQEIGSNEVTFVFTGIKNTDIRSSLEEVLIRNAYYETSKTLTVVDRRLVRANLKGKYIDYSNFQRTTNQIVVRPSVKKVSIFDIQKGNSKHPSSYFDTASFQGDEVYALGIVYVFKNGFYSPVFHIPGRQANAFDKLLLTVVDDSTTPGSFEVKESNVRHLNLTAGQTVERWKVVNTGNAITMGYHESDNATYPTITDKFGQPVFGTLAGQKIRHHKIPSRWHIPLIDNDNNINLIGLSFDNIQYPHPDIIGHIIVMGKRDNSNRTIVDTGYYGVLDIDDDSSEVSVDFDSYASGSDDNETKYGWFASPLVATKSINKGNYITTYRISYPNEIDYGQRDFSNSNGFPSPVTVHAYRHDHVNHTQIPNTNIGIYNRKITNSVIVRPHSEAIDVNGFSDIDKVRNFSMNSFSNIVRLEDNLRNPREDTFEPYSCYYTSIKILRDVFTDLYSIRYTPVSNIVYSTATGSNIFYGGDVIISQLRHVIIQRGGVQYFYGFNTNFYVEHPINASMAYGLIDRCSTRLKAQDPVSFLVNKLGELQPNGSYLIDTIDFTTICEENILFNPDFDFNPVLQAFIPLPINFDYKSECVEKYPNRIIWSNKSISESKQNSFKVFLQQNFTVEGENLGEITALFYNKNYLLVNCKHGLLIKIPNPQELQVSEDTIFLGTGGFLSLPSKELVNTTYNYGGCDDHFSTLATPYGYVWVDNKSGKVFLYNNQLDELTSSRLKCKWWFRNNLPIKFHGEFLKYFGQNFEGNGIDFIGYNLCFDTDSNRLILTKNDYSLTPLGVNAVENNSLVYDNQQLKYNGGVISIKERPDLFEDKSFTISFSFETFSWASFHSWRPYVSFNTSKSLFTSRKNDRDIWEHGIDWSFGSFYGKKYDSIIEVPLSTNMDVTLETVNYYCETKYDDSLIVSFPTFDKIWVYNSKQSTGLLNLLPKDETKPYGNFTGYEADKAEVIHRVEMYSINQLYDLSASELFQSEQWADRQSYYDNGQGYIDKVPINHETNINIYNLGRLWDKYFFIRLFYSNKEDVRLFFNFILSKTKNIKL